MAIVEMKKIRLFLYRSESSKVLESIQGIGAVEFIAVPEELALKKEEKEEFEFENASSKLDFAVSFLSSYTKEKASLKKMIEGDWVASTHKEAESLANSFPFISIVEEITKAEVSINVCKSRLKEIEAERETIKEWSFVSVPLSTLKTGKVKTFLLKGDAQNIQILESELKEEGVNTATESHGDRHHILAAEVDDMEGLSRRASMLKVEVVSLPDRDETVHEILARLDNDEREVNEKLEKTIAEVEKRAIDLPKIKILADYMHWKKEKHNLYSSSSYISRVSVFDGWVPAEKVKLLMETISSHTLSFEIEELPLEKDETPPVEIKNKGIVKPFESITRLYGLPGYNDIDPTMFLSAFFLVFFGLCLTDVGYGIFLAVILGLILFRYKLESGTKLLLTLLMFGGISAALVGLLFGGYLGINVELLPEWAKKVQKFDPIASPIPVLILSLVLGVVQVMFGLFLKILRDAKNGEMTQGLLDQGPWLLTFLSLIAWGLNKQGMLSGTPEYFIYAILISAGLIVVTQARKGEGVFGKIFKGVFSLYDSVGYFSDILSYSRILALGLATSALAFAVNLIAVLVRDMIPVIGPVIMVIILIVGHTFNVIVNVLGAFIHSARLQFVEFFSKFITGSGREFKPFKRKERYVTIER
ncbi:MAG: hypothetical protein COV70_03670 [Parcubacteria group bacterium CG11_big_fil_rev_8_21_14_0_20_39_22]|nr:MAG: hypothetical protein COV70_03670 [Parcubacteria group bacterium CG11_big_fil_rev_8_21_14_0_20_39_22]